MTTLNKFENFKPISENTINEGIKEFLKKAGATNREIAKLVNLRILQTLDVIADYIIGNDDVGDALADTAGEVGIDTVGAFAREVSSSGKKKKRRKKSKSKVKEFEEFEFHNDLDLYEDVERSLRNAGADRDEIDDIDDEDINGLKKFARWISGDDIAAAAIQDMSQELGDDIVGAFLSGFSPPDTRIRFKSHRGEGSKRLQKSKRGRR